MPHMACRSQLVEDRCLDSQHIQPSLGQNNSSQKCEAGCGYFVTQGACWNILNSQRNPLPVHRCYNGKKGNLFFWAIIAYKKKILMLEQHTHKPVANRWEQIASWRVKFLPFSCDVLFTVRSTGPAAKMHMAIWGLWPDSKEGQHRTNLEVQLFSSTISLRKLSFFHHDIGRCI